MGILQGQMRRSQVSSVFSVDAILPHELARISNESKAKAMATVFRNSSSRARHVASEVLAGGVLERTWGIRKTPPQPHIDRGQLIGQMSAGSMFPCEEIET